MDDMKKRIVKLLVPVVIVYVGICAYSVAVANICMLILVMVSIPAIVIKKTLTKKVTVISYTEIKDNPFLIAKNVLQNKYVIVTYERNNYIIVRDNPYINNGLRDLRSFRVDHGKVYNVNESWYHICDSFNENSMIENLISYFGGDVKIEITAKRKVNLSSNDVKPVQDYEKPAKDKEVFVDFNNIKVDRSNAVKIDQSEEIPQQTQQKEVEESQSEKYNDNKTEIFDFADLLGKSSKKININTAQASEISILPGINIVLAKKIVAYRQLKGAFKTEEEFFECAQLKEHFIEKVRDLIEFTLPENKDSDEDDPYRIVD